MHRACVRLFRITPSLATHQLWSTLSLRSLAPHRLSPLCVWPARPDPAAGTGSRSGRPPPPSSLPSSPPSKERGHVAPLASLSSHAHFCSRPLVASPRNTAHPRARACSFSTNTHTHNDTHAELASAAPAPCDPSICVVPYQQRAPPTDRLPRCSSLAQPTATMPAAPTWKTRPSPPRRRRPLLDPPGRMLERARARCAPPPPSTSPLSNSAVRCGALGLPRHPQRLLVPIPALFRPLLTRPLPVRTRPSAVLQAKDWSERRSYFAAKSVRCGAGRAVLRSLHRRSGPLLNNPVPLPEPPARVPP